MMQTLGMLYVPNNQTRLSPDLSSHYNVSFPAYLGAQYDASTTNFTYGIPAPSDAKDSEPLYLTVSFLSPITPQSTLRQAIPAAYVEVTTSGQFEVDVYMDVNGLWVTAERDAHIVWDLEDIDYEDAPTLKSWKVKRRDEMKFAEIRDRAEYGKLYFTGPAVSRYSFVIIRRD